MNFFLNCWDDAAFGTKWFYQLHVTVIKKKKISSLGETCSTQSQHLKTKTKRNIYQRNNLTPFFNFVDQNWSAVQSLDTPDSLHVIFSPDFAKKTKKKHLPQSCVSLMLLCPLVATLWRCIIVSVAGRHGGWEGPAEEMDHLPEGPAPVFAAWRWISLQHHPGHVCVDAQSRRLEEHCVLRSFHLSVVS